VTVIAALGATGYAFLSCRFVVVSYVSPQSDYPSSILGDRNKGDVDQSFKIPSGLFSWSQYGQCIGYQQRMLSALSEPIWDGSRIVAIFSVLFSLMMILWIIFMTTLSMRSREVWCQTFFFAIQVCLVGMSFGIFSSSLCTNKIGDRYNVDCTLDEGGLVAIAAAILWFASALISCYLVRGPDNAISTRMPPSELDSRLQARKRTRRTRKISSEEEKRRDYESRQGLIPIDDVGQSSDTDHVMMTLEDVESGSFSSERIDNFRPDRNLKSNELRSILSEPKLGRNQMKDPYAEDPLLPSGSLLSSSSAAASAIGMSLLGTVAIKPDIRQQDEVDVLQRYDMEDDLEGIKVTGNQIPWNNHNDDTTNYLEEEGARIDDNNTAASEEKDETIFAGLPAEEDEVDIDDRATFISQSLDRITAICRSKDVLP
jgi:hypothetical protein